MGCGCGGGSGNVRYIYTSGTGVQKTYMSENEAKAAKIRDNHAGTIRAVMQKK